MIEVRRSGPLATVQDLGRPGYAHLGVGRSGAADRAALRLANRLVGNTESAAAIEITLGGFGFVAQAAVTVAVTGAMCPGPLGWGAAVTIAPGDVVELGRPSTGLHCYLAVRGGIAVPPVLGSRSTDTLGGLGPPPLIAGQLLAIGTEAVGDISGEVAVPSSPRTTLRVIPGPRADWFEPDALAQLCANRWSVRPDSNRIGVRLDGEPLRRRINGELATEPMLPGALQVPPDGHPILLGPDAPVTGGYPVIAVVIDGDLDAAAQLRPGAQLAFVHH